MHILNSEELFPDIKKGDVIVWFVSWSRSIFVSKTRIPVRLANYIPESEKKRFEKIHWHEQIGAILGSAVMGRFLNHYTGIESSRMHLRRNFHGKPVLPGSNSLDFNLSRTKEAVFFGISSTGPIGVDIEEMKPSRKESFRKVFKVPAWPDNKVGRCWSAMESLCKGKGYGFSRGWHHLFNKVNLEDVRFGDFRVINLPEFNGNYAAISVGQKTKRILISRTTEAIVLGGI